LFFVALVGFVFSATKTKHLELRNTSKDVIPAKAGIHIVRILTLILIAGSFFVLTIKSARNVEYFVPLMVIFSAFVLNFVFNREENLAKVFKERMLKKKFINFLVLLYFLFALPYISFLGIKTARGFFEDGFDFNHFSSAAKAIEKESKPEEIVFHSSWDEFPFLFYNNTKNYYIVGLDPTFFYLYNQELYEKWEDIRHGKQKENLYKIIKDEFNASWVFVDKKYKDFEKNIKSDERFIKIYEDEESSVYKTE
ncbi:MAG: hypothetical protein U9P90_03820, partial [Patescibacteria group bacterium]|nr:hypothetical protein [Patescibacteria group bacterium]